MKIIFKLTILLLTLLSSASAAAYDFEVDGIYYSIVNGNEVSVTRSPSSNKYSGDVTIPASVTYGGTTYSVTSIYDRAFSSCTSLTSVTIPNSVTTIGGYAFFGCSGLTCIEIPNSVITIGDGAFSCSSLTTITIGNSVTSIGNYAFDGCSGLTSIDIPNSVTTIGNGAFSHCSGLTSVTIGNSVTSIGADTFYECSGLASVTIPNSVTSIGNSAFSSCESLTSVTIPNSVTTIGNSAFSRCTSLTSVTIGNSVTTIGDGAFYNCSGLTRATIGNSVTYIGGLAFDECDQLLDIHCKAEIPPSIFYFTFSENTYTQAVLRVPSTSLASYRSADNWNNFFHIMVDGVLATSVSLDITSTSLYKDETFQLNAIVLPANADFKTVTWTSSNPSVATVSSSGLVTAVSIGEATISASTNDGSNLSATCKVTVIPSFDLSMPNFSHIRGSANNKFDLTVDLANRYDITGMQFDIQFPDDVTIAKDNNGEYDIWLDDSRKSRNHTATASLIGNNTYRILVSSATANSLKGHSGTVVHIMIEIPLYHVSGNKQIKYSNIILSEPDETRHTLPTKYSMISYYYKEGDANADVNVDVADYVITGNYILQNSPENFWYDAANVDHNSTIDVNDLTGITNIALGRREGGILQMPAIQQTNKEDVELTANPLDIRQGQTKTLELCLNENFAFAGFQMDLQLPEGLRLVDASLVDGGSGLSLATAELADGSIRLLASSFSLKDLAVNNSSFLKLTLAADDEIEADGKIMLNDIKFSKRDMTLHTIDHYEVPVGNGLSSLEHVYSVVHIYADGLNIIIDSPELGTAQVVTIAGIAQVHDISSGHNIIPMESAGVYIVTLNGTTAKLYLK